MKRAICIILSVIMLLSVLPVYTAFADEAATVLSVVERGESYNELSWNSPGSDYSGTLIEVSADGVNFSEYESYWSASADYYWANTEKKTVKYYRVTCYKESWDGISGNYVRTYAQPSNTVEVYPVLDYFWTYADRYDKKVIINWSSSESEKECVDGYDVFASVNNGTETLKGSVNADKYTEKTDYGFNYQYRLKSLPEYFYYVSYIVKPYFNFNGKKYYLNGSEERETADYVSDGLSKLVTKRKRITVKISKIEGVSKFKIRYTRYKLKTGKTGKTKTVTVNKQSYVIETDTKTYGYTVEVIPVVQGLDLSYGDCNDSHDPFTLMNSAPKLKKKTIKVVNTRGSKSKTDWTYKLTDKDVKTIKKFFKKKYKGNNPSRAQMAYDALEWINKKVKYDYDYKYGSLRYVDAIFNKKSGQCLQYNGAYAAVLTYLGYEARVIKGYRSDSSGNPTISHFWCEVKLNGRWYLCETGNYGKNGYWQYYVSLYRNSRGYTKNGKAAKDA